MLRGEPLAQSLGPERGRRGTHSYPPALSPVLDRPSRHPELLAERVGEILVVFKAHHHVNLGHLVRELVRVPLRQAPGDDDLLLLSILRLLRLHRGRGEDGVHALVLGVLDEAAGVDDDCVRILVLVDDVETVGEEVAEHDLAVHGVLGASERDHGDLRALGVGLGLAPGRRLRDCRPRRESGGG